MSFLAISQGEGVGFWGCVHLSVCVFVWSSPSQNGHQQAVAADNPATVLFVFPVCPRERAASQDGFRCAACPASPRLFPTPQLFSIWYLLTGTSSSFLLPFLLEQPRAIGLVTRGLAGHATAHTQF